MNLVHALLEWGVKGVSVLLLKRLLEEGRGVLLKWLLGEEQGVLLKWSLGEGWGVLLRWSLRGVLFKCEWESSNRAFSNVFLLLFEIGARGLRPTFITLLLLWFSS